MPKLIMATLTAACIVAAAGFSHAQAPQATGPGGLTAYDTASTDMARGNLKSKKAKKSKKAAKSKKAKKRATKGTKRVSRADTTQQQQQQNWFRFPWEQPQQGQKAKR
jgi:hypothetical protein